MANLMDIKDISREQLAAWLKKAGIEPYRASQILTWVYLRQADTFDIMTDISKSMRKLLLKHFTIKRLVKENIEIGRDGTRKYLFRLEDGKYIESVLIPERDHYTLCVSSQVGCAQGCHFCLTAKVGFARNLTRGELVAQVRDVEHDLGRKDRLSNIVFMGMGEPLANYHNLVGAIETITDNDSGLRFSNRRVTVSSAGLLSKLLDLGRDTRVNLAISLNATDNDTRDMLMPVNRRYPIEKLLAACRKYPLRPGSRITFEYILIAGVNDSEQDARRLAKLLHPIKSKINLIPFNEYAGSGFTRPDESTMHNFRDILIRKNYTAIIRRSKGTEISAACGQLHANWKPD
jgi:23S rRNA (adenine2503-C2)-methyltransferase